MADASTFGGQLDAGTSFGASFGGAGDASAGPSVGADVPSIPDQPTQSAPQAAQEPSFGASLRNMLPGPHYTPPDPAASPADQQADAITQRINRGNQVINNPLAQLFMGPEGIAAARDKVQGLTQQLQSAKQQQQQQADIQKQATNFGVPKSAQNPMMTGDTIDNYLLDQYKSGDFTAANALKARGKGDWVQDFAGAALDGAGTKLKAADAAATKLSAANGNQAAYNAAVKSLTPEDRQALTDMGMPNIPEKASGADGWQGIVEKHGATFAQAQQLHAQTVQKLNNMTNFDQSAPKEVGESIAANVTLGNTNEPAFDGKNVKIRTMDGQPGVVGSNGSVHTDKFGLSSKNGGWNAWNPEREKTFQSYTNDENVKGALNQYNMMNKVRDTLTNDANYRSSAGLTAIKDELGTMRDVAEKSAASGGLGFSKMFGMSQGVVETTLNKAANEWGALQNWRKSGKKPDAPGAPRMERDTIAGLKQLSQHMYDYAATEAKGRLGGAMTYAGRGGKPLDEIPLDAALKKELEPFHEQGRVDAVDGFNAHPSLVTGNQRVFFPQGSNVQGASPPRPPVPATQPPSAVPPSSPGGSPPPAAPPANNGTPAPAGGGTPNNDGVYKAIFAQESGGGRNTATSVTGARGGMQIQPGTWAQYAKPGEKIDNPADNQAVGRRIIDDLSQKSGGDPARIAVGYFSGPGNIAPPGSPTPWKVDRADPTGKKVSSYVADVTKRMAAPAGGGGATAEAPGLMTRISRMLSQGVPGSGADKDQAVADVGNAAVEHAPAIGSTIGAAGGSLGGPLGTVGGGAAGGGAGQSFKDYMQGRPQNPVEIGKQAALGGVLGVASEARPVLAAAGRVVGSGAVEGGATAIEGGDAEDVAASAAKGGAYALGGEALSRFVSSGGAQAFKALSRYTTGAQAELSANAGKLAEARGVLSSEQPKLPGDAGPNPKYEAAQKQADDATQAIKDHGQNPDDMVHAYEQAKAGTSAGEAAIMRGANSEKAAISGSYDQLRSDVREATPGQKNLKPQSVPDGPVSMIRTSENPTGKVPEAFRPDAEHAEMLVRAPAKNWGDKWQQLQDAGSELIKKRLSFLANNDKPSADAMNALFEGVRNQQKAAAKIVFGEKQGKEVIAHLENLDTRYAKVMNATGGMNYEKMNSILASGNTPARRELEKNFREFNKDDPHAIRVFNAMKAGAKGDWAAEWKLMLPVIGGEAASNLAGIPTLGGVSAVAAAGLGANQLYRMVRGAMNAKLLGKDVTFKDFLVQAVKTSVSPGNAVQRGATMQ